MLPNLEAIKPLRGRFFSKHKQQDSGLWSSACFLLSCSVLRASSPYNFNSFTSSQTHRLLGVMDVWSQSASFGILNQMEVWSDKRAETLSHYSSLGLNVQKTICRLIGDEKNCSLQVDAKQWTTCGESQLSFLFLMSWEHVWLFYIWANS